MARARTFLLLCVPVGTTHAARRPCSEDTISAPRCEAWLDAAELLSILHQVALGLVALGEKGIVHRDLAARNVLIDEQLGCKLADLGLARQADDETQC